MNVEGACQLFIVIHWLFVHNIPALNLREETSRQKAISLLPALGAHKTASAAIQNSPARLFILPPARERAYGPVFRILSIHLA